MSRGPDRARDRKRARPQAPDRARPHAHDRPAPAPAPFRSAWLALGPAALGLALLAARGAPLGVPVADDYAFLAQRAFARPLDWLGSMGASYSWRPLSRQLYVSLLGPAMLAAPWLVTLAHALLLLALFALVWDLARRTFPAPVAAAVAAFPLLGASTRVLLDWPSAAQHVLAMVFAVLALREARAGRAWTTALAVVAGVLCHEAAALALPFAVAVLWRGAPRGETRARWRRVAPALALFAAWAAAYAVALGHGVALPARGAGAGPGGYARLLGLAVPAALDLEDVREPARAVLLAAYLLLGAWAAARLLGRAGRRRLAASAGTLAAAAAWFLLGLVPLLSVLDAWDAWRLPLAALGFGGAVVGLLGVADPRLALAFTALRAAALLLGPPAPATVSPLPPVTTSELSFPRLVRLQRVAHDTRAALEGRFHELPRGAEVRFQTLPRMAEVGLGGPLALRVWYGDSTLAWRPFGGQAGFGGPGPGGPFVVAYDTHRRWQPVALEPAAVTLLGQGMAALQAGRAAEADSLLAGAERAQTARSDEFEGMVLANRARLAFAQRDFARADSLNRAFVERVGPVAESYALQAALDLASGQIERAERDLALCFALEPANATGRQVAEAMARARAGAR